jgi:hypothetical protein
MPPRRGRPRTRPPKIKRAVGRPKGSVKIKREPLYEGVKYWLEAPTGLTRKQLLKLIRKNYRDNKLGKAPKFSTMRDAIRYVKTMAIFENE